MHDFVESHRDRPASTESFKAIAEKHMTKSMDLAGNGKLDWFFNEWVYGTEVPSYRLEYSIAEEKGAKPVLTASLTQSGVSPAFKMRVPVYAEIDTRKIFLGAMEMTGSTTGQFKAVLPATPKHILLNVNHDVLTDKEEVRQVKK